MQYSYVCLNLIYYIIFFLHLHPKWSCRLYFVTWQLIYFFNFTMTVIYGSAMMCVFFKIPTLKLNFPTVFLEILILNWSLDRFKNCLHTRIHPTCVRFRIRCLMFNTVSYCLTVSVICVNRDHYANQELESI